MENIERIVYTEVEAASQLGLSRITLFRARKAGKVNFCRIGRVIRYKPEHLEEFLKDCERIKQTNKKARS
jgi:excisionase family DNA binding protein